MTFDKKSVDLLLERTVPTISTFLWLWGYKMYSVCIPIYLLLYIGS
jgi:hypothetical protein